MKGNEQVQKIAEQIALLLEENEKGADDNSIRATLEKINGRLDKIESRLAVQIPNPNSQIPNPILFHSSQERFTNLEDLADEIINKLENEKACPFEPTGKPCDHCAMCNSRGF